MRVSILRMETACVKLGPTLPVAIVTLLQDVRLVDPITMQPCASMSGKMSECGCRMPVLLMQTADTKRQSCGCRMSALLMMGMQNDSLADAEG
eukprot:1161564-Pelagomonas_calceolata.AAC.15